MSDETLTDKANRLAREAIKELANRHQPGPGPVSKHYCRMDSGLWPCFTVRALGEAEEAISVAEEEEERIANGPYYCGVEVRAMRYADPEPAEYCENEVQHEDERCPAHEEPDDDYEYERFKESRYDD